MCCLSLGIRQFPLCSLGFHGGRSSLILRAYVLRFILKSDESDLINFHYVTTIMVLFDTCIKYRSGKNKGLYSFIKPLVPCILNLWGCFLIGTYFLRPYMILFHELNYYNPVGSLIKIYTVGRRIGYDKEVNSSYHVKSLRPKWKRCFVALQHIGPTIYMWIWIYTSYCY